jgi:hypothetical protein
MGERRTEKRGNRLGHDREDIQPHYDDSTPWHFPFKSWFSCHVGHSRRKRAQERKETAGKIAINLWLTRKWRTFYPYLSLPLTHETLLFLRATFRNTSSENGKSSRTRLRVHSTRLWWQYPTMFPKRRSSRRVYFQDGSGGSCQDILSGPRDMPNRELQNGRSGSLFRLRNQVADMIKNQNNHTRLTFARFSTNLELRTSVPEAGDSRKSQPKWRNSSDEMSILSRWLLTQKHQKRVSQRAPIGHVLCLLVFWQMFIFFWFEQLNWMLFQTIELLLKSSSKFLSVVKALWGICLGHCC